MEDCERCNFISYWSCKILKDALIIFGKRILCLAWRDCYYPSCVEQQTRNACWPYWNNTSYGRNSRKDSAAVSWGNAISEVTILLWYCTLGPKEEKNNTLIQHVKVMMQDWQILDAEHRRRLSSNHFIRLVRCFGTHLWEHRRCWGLTVEV